MADLHLGLDVGSTTVKAVLENDCGGLLYSCYERHYADIVKAVLSIIRRLEPVVGDSRLTVQVTGSAGMGLAQRLGWPFCQEVIASGRAVADLLPDADVAIELGGEDAKITFLSRGMEQRMNGTCAGGTGAFIDQMAILLDTDAAGLNDLAAGQRVIYPIAARCGVFAKTDVQPLLNEGARHEDIAASVFQAVVNQTVSVLACGRPIQGKVAFLGGPLHFLSELRRRFIETLHLTPDEVLVPEQANLFVAIGACRLGYGDTPIGYGDLLAGLENLGPDGLSEVGRLPPLFNNSGEYGQFLQEHEMRAARGDLAAYRGPLFLGIDAGSTTCKVVLTGSDDEILWSYYGSNEGRPLDRTVAVLKDLYSQIPVGAHLAAACVTGYGEALLKKALQIDFGEIETIAHYRAARHFLPGVQFILDIGGQDMKCLTVRDGVIDSIMLNEACSSGCGSFIETFAKGLGYSVQDFAQEALFAPRPIDLGTRCTVFMNSRVKQAQKEGATVGDISAGLSYSVIKNALYKVIKLRDPESIGSLAIVQGGAFLNDAVLRAFELVSGVRAVRPDIAGLMGAFGCALLARERCSDISGHSTLRQGDDLASFNYRNHMSRCQGCENHCLLTSSTFPDGSRFISGNRCERAFGHQSENEVPNLFAYKARRTFDYEPLDPNIPARGTVCLPRVLNMYENYPFWHTLFTKLNFRVLLSPNSSKVLYQQGLDTIPSESTCYPAKLVHGHIAWLVGQRPDFIFYPCVAYEQREFSKANNHFNCPIVTSYPEVIRNNMDVLKSAKVAFKNPFLNLNNRQTLYRRIAEELAEYHIPRKEIRRAVAAAYAAQDEYKADIRQEAERALDYVRKNGLHGIVLAGRPYHLDREVNHGIPEMVAGFGVAVFTEDSIALLSEDNVKLRVFDQWAYHSRLYRTAQFVALHPELDLIQLNSFGCGLDAVTTDQVMEILHNYGKIYTCLKIDEGNNIGAARIRVRSLLAALREREAHGIQSGIVADLYPHIPFTREMRDDEKYTVIAPEMAPVHFRLMEQAFRYSNYNLVILNDKNGCNKERAVEEGLKYVNNDACYPCVLTTGSIIETLKSGRYNPHKVAVFITQTGGGCRATNYVSFIRKALRESGFGYVPVMPLSAQYFEKHTGFKVTWPLLCRVLQAFIYGDALTRCLYRTRPYELEPGSAMALYEKWNEICQKDLENYRYLSFRRNLRDIVSAFDELPLKDVKRRPRVGIVGEILVKYQPWANNNLVEVLEAEGAEAVVPDLLGFFLYSASAGVYQYHKYGMPLRTLIWSKILVEILQRYQRPLIRALKHSHRFDYPMKIGQIRHITKPVLQLGNVAGEGWFLTGEMLELMHSGVKNIICVQPFACLPNHVTGKGMIKKIRELYPDANIAPVDYDPGASEVNQLNRIKLMLAVAERNLDTKFRGK